jgi:hypothetical protein
MTMKAQGQTMKTLNAILGALDGKKVNPATKELAIARLGKHAEDLGVGIDDLIDSASHLLDGTMTPQGWAAAIEGAARKAAQEKDQMAKKEKTKKATANGVSAREERMAQAKAASQKRHAERPKKAKRVSQIDRLEALMKRPGGATMGEIAQELGWLPRTARAAIAVKIRRERGHLVETIPNREKGQLGTVYRITG